MAGADPEAATGEALPQMRRLQLKGLVLKGSVTAPMTVFRQDCRASGPFRRSDPSGAQKLGQGLAGPAR